MKKLLPCTLALAMSLSLGAEELKNLTLGLGLPGLDEPMLLGLGISPDGRYVCGPIDFGEGVFVMDVESGVCNYDYTEDSELRNVDLQGLAIGYLGDMGITFACDGEITELPVPDRTSKYVLGEDLTNDGVLKVGSIMGTGYITHAAISENGGEWTRLPVPTEDETSYFALGSTAKAVSGDGKFIIGEARNAGPIVMWIRNDDGSYTIDLLFKRFCALDESELAKKPLAGMFPRAISNNGRYVLCRTAKLVIDEEGREDVLWFPSVYDTETAQLKQYDEPQSIDRYGTGLTGSSIADDGTFVGMIGSAATIDTSGAFVMKAGETQAQLLSEAYPEYGKVYSVCEMNGFSIPTDISADGRYILGYAFYSEDYEDMNLPSYYITYIIDTFSGTGVESAGSLSPSDEIYSLDGVRRLEMKRGINIVRSSDGSVRKFIKK